MIKTTINPESANACTHGGIFHADEVVASVILAKYHAMYFESNEFVVCRTFKVPEDLNPDAIVYDIGGGQFDHHQRGGNGCRENGVPYSSAGLISLSAFEVSESTTSASRQRKSLTSLVM